MPCAHPHSPVGLGPTAFLACDLLSGKTCRPSASISNFVCISEVQGGTRGGGSGSGMDAEVNARIASILEGSFGWDVACFNPDGFHYCLARELAESMRYGHFAGFLVFRVEGCNGGDEVHRLVRFLGRNVRDTDFIGLLDRRTVGVILQYATVENTRRVLQRLREEIRGWFPEEEIQILAASAVFPSEANTMDALENLAQERLKQAVV